MSRHPVFLFLRVLETALLLVHPPLLHSCRRDLFPSGLVVNDGRRKDQVVDGMEGMECRRINLVSVGTVDGSDRKGRDGTLRGRRRYPSNGSFEVSAVQEQVGLSPCERGRTRRRKPERRLSLQMKDERDLKRMNRSF